MYWLTQRPTSSRTRKCHFLVKLSTQTTNRNTPQESSGCLKVMLFWLYRLVLMRICAKQLRDRLKAFKAWLSTAYHQMTPKLVCRFKNLICMGWTTLIRTAPLQKRRSADLLLPDYRRPSRSNQWENCDGKVNRQQTWRFLPPRCSFKTITSINHWISNTWQIFASKRAFPFAQKRKSITVFANHGKT